LWEIDDDWTAAESHFSEAQLSSLTRQLSLQARAFFLVRPAQDGGVEVASAQDFSVFFENVSEQSVRACVSHIIYKCVSDDDANDDFQRTVGFLDPSAQASAPGWPLRNLLAYLRAVHPEATQAVRVLCWRGDTSSSRFGILRGGPTGVEKQSVVGWEKNVQGKLGPRVADLAPMMDPKRSVLFFSLPVRR